MRGTLVASLWLHIYIMYDTPNGVNGEAWFIA